MKPDDGAPVPVDRAMAPDAAPPSSPLRPGSVPRRPNGIFRRVGALAGLVVSAMLALVLASLMALVIVRIGADWLDGVALASERPRLYPRQLALRELALDVIRQVMLAGLVVAAMRWRDGAAWRRTLALAPAPEAAPARGLPPARLGLILLVWPVLHLTWVTGSAELLGVPIPRHGRFAPGLGAGAAAFWFAYVLILAPVAEELLVRGALFSRVGRLLPPAGTILLTGLLFAFAHLTPAGITRPVSLIPLGLMLGWVRWRSGRLWPCILLHAWSNLTTLAYVLWPT